MKVRNMLSAKGNPVPNQFEVSELHINLINNGRIRRLEGTMFQSYASNIVFKASGKVFLDENYWDYSVTTGRYRNDFLGEGIAETRKKIESGEYSLVDLNK